MRTIAKFRYPDVVRDDGGCASYVGSAQRKFSLVPGRIPEMDHPEPHRMAVANGMCAAEISFGGKGPPGARVKFRLWRASRWTHGQEREVELFLFGTGAYVLSDRARGAFNREKLREERLAKRASSTSALAASACFSMTDELFATVLEWNSSCTPIAVENLCQIEELESAVLSPRSPTPAALVAAAARLIVMDWPGEQAFVIEFEVPAEVEYAFALVEAYAK